MKNNIACELGLKINKGAHYFNHDFKIAKPYPDENSVQYLVKDPSSKLSFIVEKPKDKRIKTKWLDFRNVVKSAIVYNLSFDPEPFEYCDSSGNFIRYNSPDLLSITAFKIKNGISDSSNCSKESLLMLCNDKENFTDYLIELSYSYDGGMLEFYDFFRKMEERCRKSGNFWYNLNTVWMIVPKEKFLKSGFLVELLEESLYVPNSKLLLE